MLIGLVMVSCAAAGLTEPSVAAAASRRSHDLIDEPGISASNLFALSVTLPDTLPRIANELKSNIASGRQDDVRSHLARNDRNRHDRHGFVPSRSRHRRRAGHP